MDPYNPNFSWICTLELREIHCTFISTMIIIIAGVCRQMDKIYWYCFTPCVACAWGNYACFMLMRTTGHLYVGKVVNSIIYIPKLYAMVHWCLFTSHVHCLPVVHLHAVWLQGLSLYMQKYHSCTGDFSVQVCSKQKPLKWNSLVEQSTISITATVFKTSGLTSTRYHVDWTMTWSGTL